MSYLRPIAHLPHNLQFDSKSWIASRRPSISGPQALSETPRLNSSKSGPTRSFLHRAAPRTPACTRAHARNMAVCTFASIFICPDPKWSAEATQVRRCITVTNLMLVNEVIKFRHEGFVRIRTDLN